MNDNKRSSADIRTSESHTAAGRSGFTGSFITDAPLLLILFIEGMSVF